MIAFSFVWPKTSPARTGFPSAPSISSRTSESDSDSSKLDFPGPQSVQVPEDDPGRLLELSGEPQLHEHPVDPVRRLSGVLQEDDRSFVSIS